MISDEGDCAPPSDTTPPSISYVLNPASPDGLNGWYTGNVTLTWIVTENESPDSLITTGCANQNITADQLAITYSCDASSDGGEAATVSVTIKLDGTAPTVAYTSASGDAGLGGWYTSNVTATFTATDNVSGFAGPSSTAALTSVTTGEGSRASP